jgi:hypothetical protein
MLGAGKDQNKSARRCHSYGNLTCMALLSLLPLAAPALGGEDDMANMPVRQRPHSEYDPLGIRADAFMFFPSVTIGLQYDSNVFASVEAAGDWALVTAPELHVVAERSGGSYELELGARHYAYQDFSSEDRTDAHARFRVSRQIRADLKWDTAIEAARRHELRGDSFSPASAAEPIPFRDLRAETSLTRIFNHLGVTVGGRIRDLAYEDVDAIGGGTLDQSQRDGTIITGTIKPFYEFSPGYRAYGRLDLSQRDYAGEDSQERDSQGYDARGGLEFRMTPLIFGSVEAGYLTQDYSNPLIPTVDGLSTAARATWLMTPLMTLSLFAERSVAEMASPDVEGRLDFIGGVQFDYEVLRNLIVSLEGSYKNEDFVGTTRSDDIVKFSAKLDYLLSRNIHFGLKYNYTERSSDIPEYDFEKHLVTLNVIAQH